MDKLQTDILIVYAEHYRKMGLRVALNSIRELVKHSDNTEALAELCDNVTELYTQQTLFV